MRRPWHLVYRHTAQGIERRCAKCRDWFALSEFYGVPKVRSWCKQCFMAAVVARKRVLRDPAFALLKAWPDPIRT